MAVAYDVQAQPVCRKEMATIAGFDYLAKVITGIEFKDGEELKILTRMLLDGNCLYTKFDNSSIYSSIRVEP